MVATKSLLSDLARVRELDQGFQVFGAFKHQYRLGPCLSQQQLAQFESLLQVSFPHDLREFLLTAGNGGAGPGYGLHRLGVDLPSNYTPNPANAKRSERGCGPLPGSALPVGPASVTLRKLAARRRPTAAPSPQPTLQGRDPGSLVRFAEGSGRLHRFSGS